MKTKLTLMALSILGAVWACKAQTTETDSIKMKIVQKDTTKQMNLLDEQTKMFGQVFKLGGLSDEENPTGGGATNYLDMINKMEGSEELKQQVRKMYELYNTSLDPTKKAELKIKVNKMLEDAMTKSQSEQ